MGFPHEVAPPGSTGASWRGVSISADSGLLESEGREDGASAVCLGAQGSFSPSKDEGGPEAAEPYLKERGTWAAALLPSFLRMCLGAWRLCGSDPAELPAAAQG